MKVVVALRDNVSEMFMQPMFVPSVGIAYRSIQDEAARGGEDNVLAKHGEDFTLYHLASFDESTGALVPLSAPFVLVEVAALLKKE